MGLYFGCEIVELLLPAMAAVCAEASAPPRISGDPEGGEGEGEHPQVEEMLEVLKMGQDGSGKSPRITSSLSSSVLESLVSQETEDSSSDASGCDDVFLVGDRRPSRSSSLDEGNFSGDDSGSCDAALCPPDGDAALVLTPRPGKVRCLIESFTEISSRDDVTLPRKPRRSNVSGQSGKLVAGLPVPGGEVTDSHGHGQRESDVGEHLRTPEASPAGAPVSCDPAEGGKAVSSGGGGPAGDGEDPPPVYRQEASIVFKNVANQANGTVIGAEPGFHLGFEKTEDREREDDDISKSVHTPQEATEEQIETELLPDASVSDERPLAPEPIAEAAEINETLISRPDAASDENSESENDIPTSLGKDKDQEMSEKPCEDEKTETVTCETLVAKTDESGHGTPVALVALCVAVLAIALSHPWSANLSSGIVAAAMFFSLSKLTSLNESRSCIFFILSNAIQLSCNILVLE